MGWSQSVAPRFDTDNPADSGNLGDGHALAASFRHAGTMGAEAEAETGTLNIAILQDGPDLNIFNPGSNSI